MERTTSKLKTLGDHHGEHKVIFTLLELEMEKENAVFKWLPHSQLLDPVYTFKFDHTFLF